MIVVMIVVIVSSFTIMVLVIMLVFVASLDFGYLVALRQYLELPKEKVKKQKSRFQSLYAQGSSSHIFGTLGIPATSASCYKQSYILNYHIHSTYRQSLIVYCKAVVSTYLYNGKCPLFHIGYKKGQSNNTTNVKGK